MQITTDDWTVGRTALVAAIDAAAVLFLLGLYNPRRFNWALRILTGIGFLIFAAYLVYELFFTDDPIRLFESRGTASPRNALLGFVTMGLPCLAYTLRGWPFRPRDSKRAGDLESEQDPD